jgi:dephospho-CoA kinase
VFTDGQALKLLNSILHPRIMRDFRDWASRQSEKAYVMQEAAIIFESGYRNEFDFIIQVSCPKKIAIDRVIKRDKIDGNSVLRRMQFQMEDEEKSRMSDFVIINDGSKMVIPQVLSIHQQLLEICAKGNDEIAPGAADA